MRQLHVWDDDCNHVGIFSNTKDVIEFHYDDSNSKNISLSMINGEKWNDSAPKNFLENLLPDEKKDRILMAKRLGIDKDNADLEIFDNFDLLNAVDSCGGFIYTKKDALPKEFKILKRIDDRSIAFEISNLEKDTIENINKDDINRFSLAGTQKKFTLTNINNEWYQPNVSLPSTHIFKPESINDINIIETQTIRLAGECGIKIPDTEVLEFFGTRSFVTKRFDRDIKDGKIKRLRQEDFIQALGLSYKDKFNLEVKDCINLLNKIDSSGTMTQDWLRQLAFNSYIGNCDAHGKNYSIIEKDGKYELSPLYDSIFTRYWGDKFDSALVMNLVEEDDYSGFTETIEEKHIIKMVKNNNLNEEETLDIFRNVKTDINNNIEKVMSEIEDKELANDILEKYNSIKNKEGDIFVREHIRNGHIVRSHYRRKSIKQL